MENPLELLASADSLEQAAIFALDLADGVSKGLWTSRLNVIAINNTNDRYSHWRWSIWPLKNDSENIFEQYMKEKWNSKPPSTHLMQSLEYLEQVDKDKYLLTPKAFALLEKPAISPSVFISYKREYSSALALLVEAKLKLQDKGIGIFIDKLIKPGDNWEDNIREKIKQSRYFICLLAPDTYVGSEWVRKELEWAYDAGCEIISVFHGGAALNDRYPVWLGKKQIIKVDFETAKHYESALDEILVGLGYSTY